VRELLWGLIRCARDEPPFAVLTGVLAVPRTFAAARREPAKRGIAKLQEAALAEWLPVAANTETGREIRFARSDHLVPVLTPDGPRSAPVTGGDVVRADVGAGDPGGNFGGAGGALGLGVAGALGFAAGGATIGVNGISPGGPAKGAPGAGGNDGETLPHGLMLPQGHPEGISRPGAPTRRPGLMKQS